ncbi:hypothetical protein [Sphingomonas sp. OK281]|uniref:hypothetical protein n=1 Tax=Sphingomonas sp. OK281 TaxID=1881067 RepID=UPI00111418CD|nr:hypothetical protein [Sphingomonas sp. OK281]
MPAIERVSLWDDGSSEICRQHAGRSRTMMDYLPHPSVLERRMDDQSVLARLAQNVPIARMHEDLAQLYREQLIAALKR